MLNKWPKKSGQLLGIWNPTQEKKICPLLLVALKATQPKPENVIFISIRCILKYYFKRNFALTMFGMQEKLFPKAIPLKEHSNILNINMFK